MTVDDQPRVEIEIARERCAAYLAARGALEAAHATRWPDALGEQARRAALDAVMFTAEGLTHGEASAARRRCVRSALAAALELTASCDVAHALGTAEPRVLQAAGKSVALLGLLLHASHGVA